MNRVRYVLSQHSGRLPFKTLPLATNARQLATSFSRSPLASISSRDLSDWSSSHIYNRVSPFKNFKFGQSDKPESKNSARGPEKKDDNKEYKDGEKEKENKDEDDRAEPEDNFRSKNKDKDKDDDDDVKSNKRKPPMDGLFVLLLTVMGASLLVPMMFNRGPGKEISFQEFVSSYLETRRVDRLDVYSNPLVVVHLKDSTQPVHFYLGTVDGFEERLEEVQRELGFDQHQFVPVLYKNRQMGPAAFMEKASSVFITLLMVFLLLRLVSNMGMGGTGNRGGRNIFSFGRSPAVLWKPGEKKVLFKDVAGLDEAKVEVMEFVKFLQHPSKFTKLGAKIPKGALLVGPPGTGKTLLAKAVAGEASVKFYSISGSDFIEMFVGVGPARVRDLFAQARSNSPCIIFIDEIDAVGRSRGRSGFSSGNDEREATLNQLLVEMDGFQSEHGVVVLAGTNRADILDKALLRPGRFDRQIQIDKPDIKGRRQIFEVHLKPLKLAGDISEVAGRLAALTPGFVGADIANVCNEAAIIAARRDKTQIELVDFEAACDRVIAGVERNSKVMTPTEKKTVAVHEAGHAVAGWFLEHADPLLKVTIVPRSKGSLGFAQYLPQEFQLYSKQQLRDMMCMALGGRAAEQIFFERVSTGAADDLKRVTKMAYAQVTVFGMNEKVGQVSYQTDDNDSAFVKPFSEATAALIDSEVSQTVQFEFRRVLELLAEKKHLVQALSAKLEELETINHDIIVSVLGPRPFISTPSYAAYVQSLKKDDAQPSPAPTGGESNPGDDSDKKDNDKHKDTA